MGKPIFIAGATATGKSAVALEVAKKIGGQIVSVDSMQVYQKMDIGTAKPTAEQRAQIPHHLIDCTTIREGFDVARFIREAENKQKNIKQPILCGHAWTQRKFGFVVVSPKAQYHTRFPNNIF